MAMTRLEKLLGLFLRAVVRIFFTIFQLFSPERGKEEEARLPPISSPLLTAPAIQLARLIRRKEVTSVEVVQAYIDRIQEVNPLINALVKDRFAAALQEAAQVDKLIEEETGGEDVLEDRLPLLGVPFTVKEAFALQGMPNSTGLLSRRAVVSGVDAPSVALLKRAGAIPLGVTNCSELCMWLESHNHLYGITRNPYNLSRIVGGSSGGEGSIIASGASVIGVGSDIGGSIRMPCFFNGIFGHKPTVGIVSNAGQYPPPSGQQPGFLCTGPMCRYAGDLVPMLKIMAGPAAEKLSLSAEVDLRKIRFFSVPHDGGSPLLSPVDPQLIQAQKRVVQQLEADFGVKVKEIRIPQLKYSFQIWGAMMSAPGKDGKSPTTFAELMGEGRKVWPVWELFKWMLGLSSHTVAAIGMYVCAEVEKVQKNFLVLLCVLHIFYMTHSLSPSAGIFNILGLSVTQCPLGLSAEGLPMGIQLVAGKLQDRLPLATALYLEKAFGVNAVVKEFKLL
uniref:Fatty acid amide hydrolase 2a n=1 Tax=Astyanax mexicanus TaxID=7994 RepID=A0A8B9L240_ASTMX